MILRLTAGLRCSCDLGPGEGGADSGTLGANDHVKGAGTALAGGLRVDARAHTGLEQLPRLADRSIGRVVQALQTKFDVISERRVRPRLRLPSESVYSDRHVPQLQRKRKLFREKAADLQLASDLFRARCQTGLTERAWVIVARIPV